MPKLTYSMENNSIVDYSVPTSTFQSGITPSTKEGVYSNYLRLFDHAP